MSLKTISDSKAILDKKEKPEEVITDYRSLFDEQKGGDLAVRQQKYMHMVNSFYNMVTDIYEYGWGQSFHFAPRHKTESFEASIARHEYYLSSRMGLKKGMRVVDLGCGVGGPGRAIARFSGASVIGVNNNDYQIQRCRETLSKEGPKELCSYTKGDFMKLLDTFEPESLDGGFQVEAFAHCPDRIKLFKDLFTILKPGALFAGYDWVVTPRHDPRNSEHVRIKKSIELGNSLPELPTIEVVLDAIKACGFEVVESEDLAERHNPATDIPWYDALDASYSINGFKHTRLGRYLTDRMIWVLESVKIAPKGTGDIHKLLTDVAQDLALSGKFGTFSPMFFYVIRKPMK